MPILLTDFLTKDSVDTVINSRITKKGEVPINYYHINYYE